jgi:exopolysaccharide biosynthesis polyprenyl glycosylphosphotransferase
MTGNSRRRGLRATFAVGNVMLLVVSYALILAIRPYEQKNYAAVELLAPWIFGVWMVLFGSFDLFRMDYQDLYEGFAGIVLSSSLLVVATFAMSFFIRAFAVPRSLVGLAFFLQLVLLCTWRVVFRLLYKRAARDSTVILAWDGVDAHARDRAHEVLKRVGFGVADVVMDGPDSLETWMKGADGADAMMLLESPSTGSDDEAVIWALARGMTVYRIPSVGDVLAHSATVHVLGETPVFEMRPLQAVVAEQVLKRVCDLVLAPLLLLVMAPIMAVVSLTILIDSGRPIFLVQQRLGLHGRSFNIVKFRTMVCNAEDGTGAVLAQENDPRVTRSGRFLRKARLDELPQLWNIIRGEMSLVGPRPERPEIAEHVEQQLPAFHLRLYVKPGLTGLAQTKGTYATRFEDKLKLDILYTRSRSVLATDLSILLNTLRTVITPRKAR